MPGKINLQDVFLNKSRQDKTVVTIFLINGFQIRGIVTAFDNFTVLVCGDGKQQLIYKHAISTISPQREIAIESEAG